MAHSIRDLIAKVPDVNLGNRYRVEIFLPEALKSWNAQIDRIQFYCQQCNLPGTALTQVESRIYGQKRKMAVGREDGTTITAFLFDYQGINIKLFNAWHDYMVKPETKRLEYYNNYIGRVRITLLNNRNLPIYVCNLEECYPAKITEHTLGYGQKEILPIEIEWWYRSKSYMSESDLAGMVESSIKEGTAAVGNILDEGRSVINDILGTVNDINNTIGQVREIGKIIDNF